MKVSNKLPAFVEKLEGLKTRAYQDSKGVWTIGIGHTSAAGYPKVRKGMEISKTEAYEIFNQDIQKFEDFVNGYVKVPLKQHQFDALVSFTFNVGPGNLQRSTLLRLLNSGNYEGAADQFKVWIRSGGKVLNGLIKRREAEASLFKFGYNDKKVVSYINDDILKFGVFNSEKVKKAQEILVKAGYKIFIDGDFGKETESAVRRFQADRGLKVDGVIGGATWAELERDVVKEDKTVIEKPKIDPEKKQEKIENVVPEKRSFFDRVRTIVKDWF